MDQPQTLVLIDRNRLSRESLARTLGSSGIAGSVTSFASVAEWLGSEGQANPAADIAILVHRGGDPSAASLWELRQLNEIANLPVVIVSDDERPDAILRALDFGAKAYIPSSIGIDIALEAIRLVAAGGTFVPANSLSDYRRTSSRENRPASRLSLFTARQQAVIALLRQGKSNKTIAHELNMRESTVKVHVRNIMKAIHAKNRTEIAVRLSSVNGDIQ